MRFFYKKKKNGVKKINNEKEFKGSIRPINSGSNGSIGLNKKLIIMEFNFLFIFDK